MVFDAGRNGIGEARDLWDEEFGGARQD